jgi:NAD(P)-dependent dehydrogenase (short-subunit alcohol dehydrogenase family)
LGVQARPIQADLADAAARRRLMDTILAETGPLHALVNNASSFEPDSAAAMDEAGARSQLEVNLLAPLALAGLMAQSLAQTPPQEPAGLRSVIHVLDQKVFNLNPDYFSYTVSKLALERAVALQAQALAPALRVCGVAPGVTLVSGPMSEGEFSKAHTLTPLPCARLSAMVSANKRNTAGCKGSYKCATNSSARSIAKVY